MVDYEITIMSTHVNAKWPLRGIKFGLVNGAIKAYFVMKQRHWPLNGIGP